MTEEDKLPADHKKPPTKDGKGKEKILEKEKETLPTNYETGGEKTLEERGGEISSKT